MFKKIKIYVVRTDKQNNIRDSAPCVDCTKILKALNIKKIIYSNNQGNFISINPEDYTTQHVTLGRRLVEWKRTHH